MDCHDKVSSNEGCVRNTISNILTAQGNNIIIPSHCNHTTIPFTLLSNSSCLPFVGVGITYQQQTLAYVESPVFKARKFVNDANNCVQLELLLPIYKKRRTRCHSANYLQLTHRYIHNFTETGICITLDLASFCGITCLDPITPIQCDFPISQHV